ncbi:hypothetical protein ElyMa_005510000 [Elysia marginata]|uniref:RRM domain-containing protein n=1 Tax=Elysia marginata TaxID=1093978 RepID=A0AAV4EU20_9GAST|nr:hypothetical protein ElyMa_005510000 [Elysia marginata]
MYEDEPVEVVRLVISNIPLSVANVEIEKEVKLAGYKTLSSINEDLARDQAEKLTSYRNGNRSVFVVKPTGPLPKSVKVINNFIAFLFYAERYLVEAKAPNRNIQTESDPPLTLTDHPATSDFSHGGESHIPAVTVDTAYLASAVVSKQPEVRSQSETQVEADAKKVL